MKLCETRFKTCKSILTLINIIISSNIKKIRNWNTRSIKIIVQVRKCCSGCLLLN